MVSVLLVNSSDRILFNCQPLGVLYLASMLERHGFDVHVLDLNMIKNKEKEKIRLRQYIDEIKPRYVGFSANISSIHSCLEHINDIKKELKDDTKIILGGPFPTIIYENILRNHSCDFVVRGEGENTMVELISTLENKKSLAKVKGISFKRNNRIVKTEERELIENLDDLPFPAYHLADMEKYYSTKVHPSSSILTSRGCPGGCIYCFHGVHGYRFRARSPKNVIDEIDHLVSRYSIKGLQICDDNFSLDRDRVKGILDQLIKNRYNLTLEFLNGLNAGTLTKKIVEKMYYAGTTEISISPETGCFEIFDKVKKAGFGLRKIENVTQWCKGIGIKVHLHFILGFPWETKKAIEDTIQLAIKLDPYAVIFWKLMPFPGTPLYEYAKKKNILKHDLMDYALVNNYEKGYLDGEWFIKSEVDERELNRLWKSAYRRFYLRPSWFLSTIKDLRTPKSIYETKILMRKFRYAIKFSTPPRFL